MEPEKKLMNDLDKSHVTADSMATHSQLKFSAETLEALHEFGEVLRRIHNRLISEGVAIKIDSHYAQRNEDK